MDIFKHEKDINKVEVTQRTTVMIKSLEGMNSKKLKLAIKIFTVTVNKKINITKT